MNLIVSGVLTPFEVTFIDPGLFVQAAIYDMTSGTPVFLTTANLAEVTTGTYVGTFTPVDNTTYLLVKRVYTDGTYTVLDTDYDPDSETVQSKDLSSGGGGGGSSTGCGLLVILASSSLDVILSESDLITQLQESEMNVGLSSDSLEVIFPCNG